MFCVCNRYNMASTAKFLLEKGADPTRKNKYGTTALHFAARTGNVALTWALLNSPNVNVNETCVLFFFFSFILPCLFGFITFIKCH